MERYSQSSPELQKVRLDHANQRWKQLYELEKESAAEGLKYLLLVNAGGAVATLSFIGAIGKDAVSDLPKVALGCFAFGVACVGVTRAIEFHHMNRLFREWKAGVELYFKDEKTWEILSGDDDNRAQWRPIHYMVPYTSFALFLIGCACGFVALL